MGPGHRKSRYKVLRTALLQRLNGWTCKIIGRCLNGLTRKKDA